MSQTTSQQPDYLGMDAEGLSEPTEKGSCEESSVVSVRTGCCSFNPVSGSGKRWHQSQMLLLPFVPIAALIAQNCWSMMDIIIYQSEMKELRRQVDGTVEMGLLLTALQVERAEVAYFIFSNGTRLRTSLSETFEKTDHVLEEVHTWPEFTETSFQILNSKLRFQIKLEDLRETLNPKYQGEGDSVQVKMNWYTSISYYIMDAMIQRIKDADISSIWKLLVSYKDLIRSVEFFGISTVEGLNYFGRGTLNAERFVNYITYDALAWKSLNQTKDFVPVIRDTVNSLTTLSDSEFQNISNWRRLIKENKEREVSLSVADEYYYMMVSLTDELRNLQAHLLSMIRKFMNSEVTRADTQSSLSILLLILLLLISPVIIFITRHATNTIQLYAASLSSRTRELRREKHRSDRLIYQMLPEPVAVQLRDRKSVPAESYRCVTVYFCDIVGFTRLAAESTPLQVVELLNCLYNMFDSRIENYDVYKVETIGDSYMVVSGLPHPNGIRHVSEIADLALDMIEQVRAFRIPYRPDKPLEIRAGMNSGPCVAGIVGTKMPRYCLFGDTVNVASRMESTGEAMRVHITQSSKELLEAVGGYVFEFRGYQDVKGKGNLPTFWLIDGPRDHQSREVKTPIMITQDAPPV